MNFIEAFSAGFAVSAVTVYEALIDKVRPRLTEKRHISFLLWTVDYGLWTASPLSEFLPLAVLPLSESHLSDEIHGYGKRLPLIIPQIN